MATKDWMTGGPSSSQRHDSELHRSSEPSSISPSLQSEELPALADNKTSPSEDEGSPHGIKRSSTRHGTGSASPRAMLDDQAHQKDALDDTLERSKASSSRLVIGEAKAPSPTETSSSISARKPDDIVTPAGLTAPATGTSPGRNTLKPPTKARSQGNPVCSNCGTTTTPLWRRDGKGGLRCNSCSLWEKTKGYPRPMSMKTEVIKPRMRHSKSSRSRKRVVAGTDQAALGSEGRSVTFASQTPWDVRSTGDTRLSTPHSPQQGMVGLPSSSRYIGMPPPRLHPSSRFDSLDTRYPQFHEPHDRSALPPMTRDQERQDSRVNAPLHSSPRAELLLLPLHPSHERPSMTSREAIPTTLPSLSQMLADGSRSRPRAMSEAPQRSSEIDRGSQQAEGAVSDLAYGRTRQHAVHSLRSPSYRLSELPPPWLESSTAVSHQRDVSQTLASSGSRRVRLDGRSSESERPGSDSGLPRPLLQLSSPRLQQEPSGPPSFPLSARPGLRWEPSSPGHMGVDTLSTPFGGTFVDSRQVESLEDDVFARQRQSRRYSYLERGAADRADEAEEDDRGGRGESLQGSDGSDQSLTGDEVTLADVIQHERALFWARRELAGTDAPLSCRWHLEHGYPSVSPRATTSHGTASGIAPGSREHLRHSSPSGSRPLSWKDSHGLPSSEAPTPRVGSPSFARPSPRRTTTGSDVDRTPIRDVLDCGCSADEALFEVTCDAHGILLDPQSRRRLLALERQRHGYIEGDWNG